MAHRNARLTVHGRRLLVRRVRSEGMPVAHAARLMGISRQCAHRWLARFDAEGDAGLADRASRPHTSPRRTPAEIEDRVVEARRRLRVGPDRLADVTGVPARTISRILRRHDMPYLWQLDPLTGEVIRASKTTAVRYERGTPGELVHIDVKKIGRIPDGGGWRAWGRANTSPTRVGFDYIHSAVDDHTRIAYSEVLDDEQGDTAAGFLLRAADFFASVGIDRLHTIMTDNHWSYTKSRAFAAALNTIDADHITIRPHCPRQNGKVERFNRTLQTEWADQRIYTTNTQRTQALTTWLNHYNYHHKHSSIGGPPISRLSTT